MNSKFNRRKIGGRPYVPYTAEKMELCLSEIIGKKLTQREASAKYNIPRSTLILKMKAIRNDNVQLPGRTCVFTREEEDSFVDHIVKMCDFGFPVTPLDLRFIVKTYLDSTGRKEERFTNNMPGKRWAESFLYRHKKTLSHRFGSNIKRNRAMVNEEILGNFFDNLEKEVENVPPENIFNFDETNLVDDPGKKKILCRRGCKYPEIIKNSTKAAVSVMMCGNAAGEMCPPYINYKAEKMWDTWTEGGPEGARYNRTKSGWFDCNSFEDWFFTTLFPRLRKLSGKKVVIGDNLSSHISDKVLRACLANNVAFVALPPNATHLVQPLDVAYFRPMKVGWRQVLDGWKSTPLGTRLPSIPKDTFPSLLKELIEKLAVNGPSNLRSGFRKTGIFPTDRMQVLGRLPSTRPACNIEAISSSFVEHLNTLRAGDNVATPKRKRSKVNVEPGKSIGPEDIANRNVNAEGTNNGPTNDLLAAGPSQTQTFREKKRRQKQQKGSSDNSSTEDEDNVLLESDTDSDFHQSEEDKEVFSKKCTYDPTVNDFVIVNYEGEYWPGIVLNISDLGAKVSCMARSGRLWTWPKDKDILNYELSDVISKINPPVKVSSKRELYSVNELSAKWGN